MDRQAPGIQTSSLNMGNTQTFDELFRAYHAPLCYFATTFVNSDEDAQDLVEDMFLKMWQKAQHFENIQHAQAFLYRSARNACLNYLKHGKRAGLKYEILTAEAEQFEEDYLVRMIRSEVWGEI